MIFDGGWHRPQIKQHNPSFGHRLENQVKNNRNNMNKSV
jgi:hypothetical protein